jgi:hypothetical protein
MCNFVATLIISCQNMGITIISRDVLLFHAGV